MTCENCGREVAPGRCPDCGQPNGEEETHEEVKQEATDAPDAERQDDVGLGDEVHDEEGQEEVSE